MNRIFKVIYSKAKRCRVVVSEIAKSCTGLSESHKRLLMIGVFSFILFGGFTDVSYARPFDKGTTNRNIYDLSRLNASQQSAIKNGLFLGTTGTYEQNANGGITTSTPYIYPFIDDSEGPGHSALYDFYLVYDSSNKAFEVVSLLADIPPASAHVSSNTRYVSYNVLYTVPNETAESLGLSVPSSTDKKEFQQDVVADKTLTVSGKTTLQDTTATNLTTDSSITKNRLSMGILLLPVMNLLPVNLP